MKTWFSIDGTLEPLAFDGPSYFRFPLELAELVISRYSAPGDWVLDPFCGFGTTLVAAQRLGRQAIGFEKNTKRASFAAGRVTPPSRVINKNIRRIGSHDLPPFALLFTSPPYGSFRNENWATDVHYCQIPHDSSQGLVASLHFNSPSRGARRCFRFNDRYIVRHPWHWGI